MNEANKNNEMNEINEMNGMNSFSLSLVKGVFKASRQKVNVGVTSANERGDGRAYDPAYV